MAINKYQYGGATTQKLPRTDNYMIKDDSLNQFVSNTKPAMQVPGIGGHMLFDPSIGGYGNNEKPRNPVAMQSGGQMQNTQQKFIQFIADIFDITDETQFKQVLEELGEEGLKQLETAFSQGMTPEQVKEQLNAKSNNVMYRNGGVVCPEGQRLVFKNGGCMCMKHEDGGKTRFQGKKPLKKKNIQETDTLHTKKYGVLDINDGKSGYPKFDHKKHNISQSERDRMTRKDIDAHRYEVEGAAATDPLEYKCGGRTKKAKKGEKGMKMCGGGAAKPRFCGGGAMKRFAKGGQLGGEYKDGIGKPSIIDKFVGRPAAAAYKCGGKTKKRLVKKSK